MNRPTGRPVAAFLARAALGSALALAFLMAMPLAAALLPGADRGLARAADEKQRAEAMDLLDRGEFAAASGRFDQAQRLWRQALRARPGWAVAKRRLAELPARRAAFPAQRSARQRGARARLAFVEGVTRFNAGDYRAAARLFESCLLVYPADESTRRYLQVCRDMLAEQRVGSIFVVSHPPGRVSLDGRPRGDTPLTLNGVPIGRRLVSVSTCGCEAARELEVKPRTRTAVSFTVTGGELEVLCQPEAEVLFDGRYLGLTPLRVTGLPVGAHTLQLRRPGFSPRTMDLDLSGAAATELSLRLRPAGRGE